MTDAERDRHLQQALRHAPDADAAPPPMLSAAILREARAAVAPPRGLASAWSAFWSALASPRLAGALASLMVLTIAGVMWWGRPIEQAMPVREAPAVAPAPAPATTLPEPAATPAAPPAAAANADLTVAAAQPSRDAKSESRRAAPRADTAERALQKAAPAEPARTAADAAAPSIPAAPGAPAPIVAAAPPTTTDRREAADTALAEAPKALAPAAPAGLVRERSARVGMASGAAGAAAARAPLGAGASSWDRGDGRARPVDAAFEAFVAQLDAAIGGTAPSSALAQEAASAGAAPAPPLNLLHEGRTLRTLRLAGDTLTVETPGGAVQRLPLAPGSGAALAARLAELSR